MYLNVSLNLNGGKIKSLGRGNFKTQYSITWLSGKRQLTALDRYIITKSTKLTKAGVNQFKIHALCASWLK